MYYNQLKKVPKNYFDYFILQTLTPSSIYQVFYTDMYNFFLEEKQKGNIGNFGFSEQCDPSILSPFLEKQWDLAQMPMNYFDWFLCKSDVNYYNIKNKQIPIIAQAPYKGGLLINNLPEDAEQIFLHEYGRSKE